MFGGNGPSDGDLNASFSVERISRLLDDALLDELPVYQPAEDAGLILRVALGGTDEEQVGVVQTTAKDHRGELRVGLAIILDGDVNLRTSRKVGGKVQGQPGGVALGNARDEFALVLIERAKVLVLGERLCFHMDPLGFVRMMLPCSADTFLHSLWP